VAAQVRPSIAAAVSNFKLNRQVATLSRANKNKNNEVYERRPFLTVASAGLSSFSVGEYKKRWWYSLQTTAVMSGVDVCVVCNADAQTENWHSYIIEQATDAFGSTAESRRSRTLLDTDLSRPGSADTLRTARVVVVVVSRGHLDYLTDSDGDPVYGACSPERSLILLCGVEGEDLQQATSSGRRVSYHFPRYGSWLRVQHDVEQSVLTEKLKSLILADETEVELLQTTARCEVSFYRLRS